MGHFLGPGIIRAKEPGLCTVSLPESPTDSAPKDTKVTSASELRGANGTSRPILQFRPSASKRAEWSGHTGAKIHHGGSEARWLCSQLPQNPRRAFEIWVLPTNQTERGLCVEKGSARKVIRALFTERTTRNNLSAQTQKTG